MIFFENGLVATINENMGRKKGVRNHFPARGGSGLWPVVRKASLVNRLGYSPFCSLLTLSGWPVRLPTGQGRLRLARPTPGPVSPPQVCLSVQLYFTVEALPDKEEEAR